MDANQNAKPGDFKLESTRIYCLSGNQLEELMKVVAEEASNEAIRLTYQSLTKKDEK